MDMRCPICLEPWDNDEFHEVEGETYRSAVRRFRQEGCAVFGSSHGEVASSDQRAIVRELMDFAGDDTDGLMSMLEDADAEGML